MPIEKQRSIPPLPRGLRGTRGARFWRDVLAVYDLRPDELVVLEDACRQIDLIDRMRTEIAKGTLVVSGSKGQKAPHPLLQEIRASRLLVKQLLRQLGLPDSPSIAIPAAGERSSRARAAAAVRWRREG